MHSNTIECIFLTVSDHRVRTGIVLYEKRRKLTKLLTSFFALCYDKSNKLRH